MMIINRNSTVFNFFLDFLPERQRTIQFPFQNLLLLPFIHTYSFLNPGKAMDAERKGRFPPESVWSFRKTTQGESLV